MDNQSKQNDRSQRQNQRQQQKIDWIETLWTADCRKRIIWLILPQYATKIKNMGYADAFNWIKDWANRCNMVRQLDFNMDNTIGYYLQAAMEKDHGPLGFRKLESLHWKINSPGNMELHELIRSKSDKLCIRTCHGVYSV